MDGSLSPPTRVHNAYSISIGSAVSAGLASTGVGGHQYKELRACVLIPLAGRLHAARLAITMHWTTPHASVQLGPAVGYSTCLPGTHVDVWNADHTSACSFRRRAVPARCRPTVDVFSRRIHFDAGRLIVAFRRRSEWRRCFMLVCVH